MYSYTPKLTLYYTENDSSTLKSEICARAYSNTNSTRKNGQDGVAIDYYAVPNRKKYTNYSLQVTKGSRSSVYLNSVPSLLKNKEAIGEFEDMVAASLPAVSSSEFEGLWLFDSESDGYEGETAGGLYINQGNWYSVSGKNGYYYYNDVDENGSYTLNGAKVSFRDTMSEYSASVVLSESGMIIISDDDITPFRKETGVTPISLKSIHDKVPRTLEK